MPFNFKYVNLYDICKIFLFLLKICSLAITIILCLLVNQNDHIFYPYPKLRLNYMVYFAETYPDLKIAQTLSAQLSWSHFIDRFYA